MVAGMLTRTAGLVGNGARSRTRSTQDMAYAGSTPDAAVSDAPLLRLSGYSAGFDIGFGRLTVVDDLDLEVRRGEITALVGESGSGKSVACLSLLGLNGTWRHGGARFDGVDLVTAGERAFTRLRGRRIAMIYQHPTACLDPVMSIGRHLTSTLARTRGLPRAAARAEALALLHEVGIDEPKARLDQFPPRTLRRDEPARDDRPGPRRATRPADRRRSDDGTRRHGSGAHPASLASPRR